MLHPSLEQGGQRIQAGATLEKLESAQVCYEGDLECMAEFPQIAAIVEGIRVKVESVRRIGGILWQGYREIL
jgi:hypothetical protein